MRIVGSVELLTKKGAIEGPFDTSIHRIGASTHLLGDLVFVAGGMESGPAPEGDVRARRWRGGGEVRTWPLHTPRYLHASVALSPTQILLIGGLTATQDSLTATPEVERIDQKNSTSERLPRLPYAAAEPAAILLPDGRILVLGGYDEDVLRETAILDMASGEWQSGPKLPSPRAGATPLLLSGHVLLLGGADTLEMSPATSALIHDLDTATWTETPLEIPTGAAIAQLDSGAFLIAGGRSREGDPIADVTLWTAALTP